MLILTLSARSSTPQTTSCEAPRVCASPADTNAAADALCAAARKAKKRLGDSKTPGTVLSDYGACQTQRDQAIGQARLLEQRLNTVEIPPQPRRKSPWWLRSGLVVASATLTGSAAYLLATNGLESLSVAFSAVAVSAIAVALLVQFLDDR